LAIHNFIITLGYKGHFSYFMDYSSYKANMELSGCERFSTIYLAVFTQYQLVMKRRRSCYYRAMHSWIEWARQKCLN